MTGSRIHPDDLTLIHFVDGRLSSAERGQVVGHLHDCSRCADYVASLAVDDRDTKFRR